jgi:hypothetical protein
MRVHIGVTLVGGYQLTVGDPLEILESFVFVDRRGVPVEKMVFFGKHNHPFEITQRDT